MNAPDSNNELHDLDRFFSETLKGASVKPSEDVWKALELKLDEKPKRRLTPWLILSVGLIVCSMAGYLFIVPAFSEKTTASSSANESNLPVRSSDNNTSSGSISAASRTTMGNSASVNAKPASSANKIPASENLPKKIQLAALKNHLAMFPVTVAGLDVKSETDNRGLKKYFIEVRNEGHASVESVLNTIRKAGYKDAFVVKQNQAEGGSPELLARVSTPYKAPAADSKAIKNAGAQNLSGPLAVNNTAPSHSEGIQETRKTGVSAKEPMPEPARTNATSKNIISATIPIQNTTNGKSHNMVTNPGNTTPQEPVKNNSEDNSGTASSSGNSEQGAGISAAKVPEQDAEKNSVQQAVTPVAQNTIAAPPDEPKNSDTQKTDSLAKGKTEAKKADSVSLAKTPAPETADPFKRFGICLLAGPEYMKPLPRSFNETTALTFNGGLRLQYFISRRFAVELGASYQTAHSSASNDTLAFEKNLNYDTYIQSTYGDMTVDPATLMTGFSPMAPINTFKVKYSYQLHYDVLNVPLNLKFYPVKRDKLSVSITAGLNSQKIISQSAQLVLYKENFNNVLNYNNMLSGKLNFSLLFGLGCELKLFKRIYIVAEPNLRYGLTNMNTTYGINGNRSKFLYFDGNAGFKIIF
ncbi:MAG: hypothetical protein ACXVPQ_04655 [Bacteroidia bacterium]